MKITVVGAGAMGSLFGAMLFEAGLNVSLFTTNVAHTAAIQNDGLKIEVSGKTRTVPVSAISDPINLDPVDLVIVLVKSPQTQPAAKTAKKILKPNGVALTLQNGLGNADIIAATISPNKVLAGSTSHGATMLAPGRIRHAGKGPSVIGPWGACKLQCAQMIAGHFAQAGIDITVSDKIETVLWQKLLINIGINAITALTGIKNGQLLDLVVTQELSRQAVLEGMQVAQALGIDVSNDVVENVVKIAKATANNRSSMGQDVDRHRETEINAINGLIVRQAQKLGLTVPINQTLTTLIQTLQTHYLEQKGADEYGSRKNDGKGYPPG